LIVKEGGWHLSVDMGSSRFLEKRSLAYIAESVVNVGAWEVEI
jgi:hypothetical protein